MDIELNGKQPAGPGAFMSPQRIPEPQRTPEQQKKREQNVRYREKRKRLMAAGRGLIPEEVPVKKETPRPAWTEESRKRLSEAMKRAHAAKPDWKREARLRRGGWLPPKEATPLGLTEAGEDRAAQLDSPLLRKDGKPYVRGPYKNRPRNLGIKGVLIDAIRRELHEHVRAGNELTPFHTNVLALTDYLRNEENDGNDGV